MKPKIITFALIVLFVNLFFSLISSHDRLEHFIPFIKIFSSGRFEIDAYSFFLIITVLLFRLIFISCGVRINSSTIGSIPQIFKNMRMLEFGVLVGAGILMQIFLYPLLYQICIEPISDIRNAPDSLRRIILVMLPLLFILLINKGGSGVLNSRNTQQTQSMSNPSTW